MGSDWERFCLRAHHDIGARALAYLGIFGLVTLMSMLVALLLSTALQKVITEPLDSMADVARQVTSQSGIIRCGRIPSTR